MSYRLIHAYVYALMELMRSQKIKNALYGLPERNFWKAIFNFFSGSGASRSRRAGPSALWGRKSNMGGL
jgi:hypothetical protein